MMNKTPPVIFGEVLADCFPDGHSVLGGAPFNVAWHLQAFGADPVMVTAVGFDALGDDIRAAMQQWNMPTSAVSIDQQHPSGIVDVKINDGEPSYDIVENSAWDFIPFPEAINLPPAILYHGSLALRSSLSRDTLLRICEHADRVFVDINLRPPWYDISDVQNLIKEVAWLKLNEHELNELVPQWSQTVDRLRYLHEKLGIKNIVLTEGEAGASLSRSSGIEVRVQPTPSNTVIDTVGAGDAFSSVLILGILKGWSMQTTFERAQDFASEIVNQRGATVGDKNFYQLIMESWN